MGYGDDADRLVIEARNLGFEVVRIDPARQIHSVEDVTLVNPTGSTIGLMVENATTEARRFVAGRCGHADGWVSETPSRAGRAPPVQSG